jgi:nucleoside-diphosphate-sugar epimerase
MFMRTLILMTLQSVEEFLKKNKIEYVYHIAAIANARRSLENVNETMVNNVAGTASILNACANAKIKKGHIS